jgi:hypothetical protein
LRGREQEQTKQWTYNEEHEKGSRAGQCGAGPEWTYYHAE